MQTKLILGSINLILLAVTVYLYTETHAWPGIVAAALLLVLMVLLLRANLGDKPANVEPVAAPAAAGAQLPLKTISGPDRALLGKFEAHFGGDAIRFLREQDLGRPFPREAARPFHRYQEQWKGPEFQFADRELEERRVRFHNALLDFVGMLTEHTYGEGAVYTMGLKEADPDRSDLFVRDQLNALRRKAAEAYEALVRAGRRRLAGEAASQTAQPWAPSR